MLFPAGSPSRIPIVSVTGTNGKTTTTRLIAHVARYAGHHVGLTSTEAVYIGSELDHQGRLHRSRLGQAVLRDPDRDLRGARDRARRHPPLRPRLRLGQRRR
jgi:cyanophycin synthetase